MHKLLRLRKFPQTEWVDLDGVSTILNERKLLGPYWVDFTI
jgi:hypothetical protein